MFAYSVLAFLPYAFLQANALNQALASFESADGPFKLQWKCNNDKLTFNMTCKTTGWCAVGFTATADGKTW